MELHITHNPYELTIVVTDTSLNSATLCSMTPPPACLAEATDEEIIRALIAVTQTGELTLALDRCVEMSAMIDVMLESPTDVQLLKDYNETYQALDTWKRSLERRLIDFFSWKGKE